MIRLLLRRTVCLTGVDAARLFYDERRFVRAGAAPGRARKTIFGAGGVQALDGDAHRHRKAMFMSVMTPAGIAAMADRFDAEWRAAIPRWTARGRVRLYDATCELLTRGVCAWAGVPLPEADVRKRTRQLTALFHDAGTVGPRHWFARRARRRTDAWIAGVIEAIRAGTLDVPDDSPARIVATHRGPDGEPLPVRTAAVELCNLLRPTVAVAVFAAHVAHALHAHPACRAKVVADERYALWFVQEVRRWYPFFPAAAAAVREDFEWDGLAFRAGTRALLDLYGINHDPRAWDAPEAFRPERFEHWKGSPFDFVPQGGGDHATGHRCAGEWLTIALLRVALRFLAGDAMRYAVPEQDLRLTWRRMPALPRDRFVIADVGA